MFARTLVPEHFILIFNVQYLKNYVCYLQSSIRKIDFKLWLKRRKHDYVFKQ